MEPKRYVYNSLGERIGEWVFHHESSTWIVQYYQ